MNFKTIKQYSAVHLTFSVYSLKEKVVLCMQVPFINDAMHQKSLNTKVILLTQ